jgi:hypothetical protein
VKNWDSKATIIQREYELFLLFKKRPFKALKGFFFVFTIIQKENGPHALFSFDMSGGLFL